MAHVIRDECVTTVDILIVHSLISDEEGTRLVVVQQLVVAHVERIPVCKADWAEELDNRLPRCLLQILA